jgi:hypothetical protein
VVGHVQHCGVDAVRQGLQSIHHAPQQIVGVQDGVVVGVEHLLIRADVHFGGIASRRKLPPRLWVTAKIVWPMAALSVQDQQRGWPQLRELFRQVIDQHVIPAAVVVA